MSVDIFCVGDSPSAGSVIFEEGETEELGSDEYCVEGSVATLDQRHKEVVEHEMCDYLGEDADGTRHYKCPEARSR